MKKFILATTLFFSIFPVYAEESPPIIEKGFKAYSDKGAKAAIETWTKGSALQGNKTVISQANYFYQIEDLFGKYLNYEIVKSKKLSKKTHIYLVVANYEKGAAYASFFTYLTPNNKNVITSFHLHTEINKAWPSTLIYPK